MRSANEVPPLTLLFGERRLTPLDVVRAAKGDVPVAISTKADVRARFDKARRVFEDAFAYDWPETSHVGPEQRRITVGMAGYTMLVVVYTHRSDRIRIISARRAGHHERKAYNDGHLA